MVTRYSVRLLLLASIALGVACGGDTSQAPAPAPAPVLTQLGLNPQSATLAQGAAVQLDLIPLDQSGTRMPAAQFVAATHYESDDPLIASVSRSGLVSGIEPGSTRISAVVTIGGITMTARTYVDVLPPAKLVLLTSGSTGWQPSVTHVAIGGAVQWVSGPFSWSGVPNKTVLLMDDYANVIDSVAFEDGLATRRFDKAGRVRYCSGGCWDPPDFGVIYIH